VSTSAPGQDQWKAAGQQTATMPAVSDPTPQGRTVTRPKARKARLLMARVDPWSVMKLSFLLSLALMIVALVAVGVLWSVLDSMGVFDSVGRAVETVTRDRNSAKGFDIMAYIGFKQVMTATVALAGVNVVLMTALGTLGAFLYNLAASLVGGLHITFTEDV